MHKEYFLLGFILNGNEVYKKILNLFSSGNKHQAIPQERVMGNTVKLKPGQQYKVIKEFTDYDRIKHPEGETWTYIGTDFLPYDDGLTLHLTKNNVPISYRLQWREDQQAEIIANFKDFVEPC